MNYYTFVNIVIISILISTHARPRDLSVLNNCEKAVWSCCQSDRILDFIPTSCFESNGCPGMHWLGKEACSNEILNSIGQKLNSHSGSEDQQP